MKNLLNYIDDIEDIDLNDYYSESSICGKSKNHIQKFSAKARREQEIEDYGKQVSMRPSQTHKDKTKYTRKDKHKNKNFD